jgi:hypothetical protein
MTISNQDINTSNEKLFKDAYGRIEPEIVALPVQRVRRINVDVRSAVATVLAAMARLLTYREQIIKELPTFDVARFDKLEDYALALSHTDTLHSTALKPTDEQKAVFEEGVELRDVMHADVNVAIRRKFIDSAVLKDYEGLVGYKNVASDLQIVAQALNTNWGKIEGKCATSLTEVEHAFKLAARLLRIAGQREQSTEALDRATDARNRAFTLLAEGYEDAQRALGYLRFEQDDADDIAPAFYAGRPAAKKAPKAEPVPAPAASSVQASPSTVTTGDAAKAGTDDAKNGPFMK